MLKTVVDAVIDTVKNDGSTLGAMLDAAITGGIYKDEILDKLLVAVVKVLAGLDDVLLESAGVALDIDIDTWFDWCDIERDAEGKVTNVTVTHNWHINDKRTNTAKKNAFVAAFTEALAPANRVINWIFFAQDYTFFSDSENADLITLRGGEGYSYGIVPVLEALGCKNVKSASAYATATGYNTSAAVGDVLTAVCDRLTYMCGDDTLGAMLEMLPNVVYFINADGVKNSVNNILRPVTYVIETLTPVVGDVTLDSLIGFPISELTFETIFNILSDENGVNLHFRPESKRFVENFYMGKVDGFTSANGKDAFYMTYSDTETRREMITILLSLVIENITYSENKTVLSKWFGSDVYDAIIGVLGLTGAKDNVPYKWLYPELADTETKVSAIDTSGRYVDTYNNYWTRDKAQYVAENLEAVVGNTLCLLGLELDGSKINSLEALLDKVVSSNLYTQDNANAILEAVKGVISKITSLEPYGEYIEEILRTSVGVDLSVWENMTVSVVDGDRETFEAALVQIIAPAAPLLKCLLAGEDISFFLDFAGNDQIVLYGSEGYAYGIIPVLEALDCEGIVTPAEFKAIIDADGEAAVKAVLDPIFNRIETIEADPANELINMLPGVIYFINSNGLDTAVRNMVNSVDTVLAALTPVINNNGEAVDLLGLLDVDLTTYNFDWIINTLLDSIENNTGFELKSLALDAIAELTVGKVVTYKSLNGETYCTMEYAAPLQKGDMVTVVLRVLIDFITVDENIENVEAILKQYIANEDNYKSVCALLEKLSETAKKDPSMGLSLHVLYYIFVGANNSLEFSDDIYHDTNNAWKFILKMFEDSDEPILREFGAGLKETLNKYLDGIFDEDGVAPDGFVSFFRKIAEFFRKIADFFRNLFKKG